VFDHGETEILFTDKEFAPTIKEALLLCKTKPLVIDVDDVLAPDGEFLGETEYESFLAEGSSNYDWQYPSARKLSYSVSPKNSPSGARTSSTSITNGLVLHNNRASLIVGANSLSVNRISVSPWSNTIVFDLLE
jgi:fatty-acyl-CoA synthase